MSNFGSFPRPMVGELDVGHAARARLMLDRRTFGRLMVDLEAPRSRNGSLVVTNWGPTVVPSLALACGQTTEQYIRAHTLLPHVNGLWPEGDESQAWSTRQLARLGRPYSHAQRRLRYCEQCVSEQEGKGFSFWLREHQLPGMDWCLQHGSVLVEVPHGGFESRPGKLTKGTRTEVEARGVECELVRAYLNASVLLLTNPAPIDSTRIRNTLAQEFERAGVRHSVNYHCFVRSVLLSRAPPRWLGRLLATIHVPLTKVSLNLGRAMSFSVMAPLLAALAFPPEDVQRLFDRRCHDRGTAPSTSSCSNFLLARIPWTQ
jgi:hypothetical protein